MARFVTVLAVGTSLALSAPADAGEKLRTVPERLVHATYVALGYDLGDQILPAESLISDPWRVTPQEREALEEIRSRLESWGRYVVVDRSGQAELLLVVRSGRRAAAGAGVGSGGGRGTGGVGVRGPGGTGAGLQPSYGGELSSPDDMLSVYDTGGAPSTPLWRLQGAGGLSGEIPLFEAFREDVERAAARRK
jgi:hypothetical protein